MNENNVTMDTVFSWFLSYYEQAASTKIMEIVPDYSAILNILERRFPKAECRVLRESSQELSSIGPWMPKGFLWATMPSFC